LIPWYGESMDWDLDDERAYSPISRQRRERKRREPSLIQLAGARAIAWSLVAALSVFVGVIVLWLGLIYALVPRR